MAIHSHLLLMLLFALFVALVGGVLLKDTVREQIRTGAFLLASLVGGALVLGWLIVTLVRRSEA
jgi:undecaprenyl pyrophosphate phosphatase UppP